MLRRRRALGLALAATPHTLLLMTSPDTALADSSAPTLASYYERHLLLRGDVALGWLGQGQPRALLDGVRQVGVSEDAWWALRLDGRLLRWTEAPAQARTLMEGVARFACGQSGWFAIDAAGALWHARTPPGGLQAAAPAPRGGSPGEPAAPRRVAEDVVGACIGDSADYFVRRDGTLWVQGLAHRGQYGDGRLQTTADFVATAEDVVAVCAHTGHAIHLTRRGVVMGTGGNRFGPLGSHGLGDKADRWGPIFDGARAIATGSRHSLAIRHDDSLWAWGEGFGVQPRRLAEGIRAVAAGNSATLALQHDGQLLQWDGGQGPRRLE